MVISCNHFYAIFKSSIELGNTLLKRFHRNVSPDHEMRLYSYIIVCCIACLCVRVRTELLTDVLLLCFSGVDHRVHRVLESP